MGITGTPVEVWILIWQVWVGLRFCISNKPPGEAVAADLAGAPLWQPGPETQLGSAEAWIHAQACLAPQPPSFRSRVLDGSEILTSSWGSPSPLRGPVEISWSWT